MERHTLQEFTEFLNNARVGNQAIFQGRVETYASRIKDSRFLLLDGTSRIEILNDKDKRKIGVYLPFSDTSPVEYQFTFREKAKFSSSRQKGQILVPIDFTPESRVIISSDNPIIY